jgi:hypothetical protein
MENKYRESLRTAKIKEGDPASLFASSWAYKEVKVIKPEPIEKALEKPVDSLNARLEEAIGDISKVTEKTVILDSLNVFGSEKLENKPAFQFSGGELAKKDESTSSSIAREVHTKSFIELIELVKSKRNITENLLRFTNQEFSVEERLKVMFITDDGAVNTETVPEFLEPFAPYFEDEVSHLFYKMIKAMKLTEIDYYISSIQFDGKEDVDLLFDEVQFFKPELIITLGALASHKVLDSKERLKDCHGQISKIQITDQTKTTALDIAVMPLFSPTLLQTAPNMKKTAWKDMQKAMEYLNL